MTQTLQSILYPADAIEPVGLDIGGDEFDRVTRSRRAYRGATAESVAAENIKLQALRERLAKTGWMKMKMKRLPTQYRNSNPNAIASGSKAQMMYFIEDAKADIDTLLDVNSDLLEALRQAKQWLEGWGSAEGELAVIEAAIAKAEGRS